MWVLGSVQTKGICEVTALGNYKTFCGTRMRTHLIGLVGVKEADAIWEVACHSLCKKSDWRAGLSAGALEGWEL